MSPRTVSLPLIVWLAVAALAAPSAGPAAPGGAPPPAPGASDLAVAGRPAARTFTGGDGLPQNSVMGLAFDRKGYLWVGTQDGAAAYNGRAWTVTNLPNREISNMVRCVFVASDGAVWFGRQDGGAARLRDGEWQSFDTASGLPNNRVNSIAETAGPDGLGALWFATAGGIARYAEGRWRTVALPTGFEAARQVVAVHEPGGDRLVAATEGGILALDHAGGASILWDARDTGSPICVLPAGEETWVGVNGGKLVRIAGGIPEVVRTYPGADVYCLLATRARGGGRVIWVGTDGEGLERYDGRTWRAFDTQSILPSESVWSLAASGPADEPSTVWVGTDGGLVRLEPGLWRSYDERTGLPGSSAYSLLVTVDDDGGQSLWAGLRGNGMVRLKDGVVTRYDSRDGLTSNSVFALHESRDAAGRRTLWVGTQGGGLGTFAGGRFTRMPVRTEGTANTVRRFLEVANPDGTRTLWAASGDGGVLRYDGREWVALDVRSGLPTNAVFSLEHTTAEDGGEALWVGTQGAGVACLRGASWSVYGLESGLRNLSVLGLHVSRFADGRRILWAGTEGGGVSMLDLARAEAGWTTLTETTDPAIPNNTVYQVLSDAADRIYLFTNKGVARLAPGRTPGGPQWEVTRFTVDDGLPSNEFNGGASYRDPLGRIWGGTVAGVTMLDPSREPAARAAAPLYIERQYLSGDGRPVSPGDELRYDQNGLTFEFALLSYYREGDTQYRTQLVGLEEHPSEWTARHTKDYTTLPAGSYVFRVWARDALGTVSGPAELAFTVRPAPWLTWWAFAVYAAAASAAALGGVRWRERTLRRRNADLEAKIAERTAELAVKVRELEVSERAASRAREEALEASRAKSTFLSNMSHELRTPLNAVLGFAQLMEREAGRSEEDRESLAVISRSGEHLLQLINDVLSISKIEAGRLTLNEEVFDLARMLAGVEDMTRVRAQAKGLTLDFELAAGAPAAVRGDQGKVRQVLINLLGNAVKFTASGGVALVARWEAGAAVFEVADTGAGIGPDELETVFQPFVQTASGRRSKEGTGLGLAITKTFVDLMGGRISAQSEPGRGTTFRVEVPLAAADAAELQGEAARVVALAPGSPGARVLVADDTWENRAVLARLLRSVGLEVREASNGLEAVEAWRAWRPDLIWMDMRMPVLDGREATRTIRDEEAEGLASGAASSPDGGARYRVRSAGLEARIPGSALPGAGPGAADGRDHASDAVSGPAASIGHDAAMGPNPPPPGAWTPAATKIIALSASAFEHERAEILAAGCDDFVTKPYREGTIFDKLSEHLGLAFARAETVPTAGGEARPSALTAERLGALPAEWVAALETALVTGNVKGIAAAVEQVAVRDDALAAELRAAVKRYDFDALLDLLERAGR